MYGQAWSELVAALGGGAGASGSVEWRVLFPRRARSILLPQGTWAAISGVRFFCRGIPRRMAGLADLFGDGALRLFGGRWLPRAKLDGVNLPREWVRLLGEGFADGSIYLGSPGAVQKATLYFPRQRDSVLIKLALLPAADDAVAREAFWLQRAREVGSLGAFLPTLLDEGALPSGRRYLALEVAPSRPGPQRFGRVHQVFLGRLATLDPVVGPWASSDAVATDRARLEAMAQVLLAEEVEALRSALEESATVSDSAPLVAAHGDFAPWNTSWQFGRLVVFDWEYATAGSNPLRDFLHFHLTPRAVGAWGLSPAYLRKATLFAGDFARQQFPQFDWRMPFVSRLVLHYLVNTLLFYVEADQRLQRDDPVVSAYLAMIGRRQEWLV